MFKTTSLFLKVVGHSAIKKNSFFETLYPRITEAPPSYIRVLRKQELITDFKNRGMLISLDMQSHFGKEKTHNYWLLAFTVKTHAIYS